QVTLAYGLYTGSSNNIIANNTINQTVGIQIESQPIEGLSMNNIVENNTILSPMFFGIDLKGLNVISSIIRNNTCIITPPGGDCVLVESGPQNNNITENTFIGFQDFSDTNHGVVLKNQSGNNNIFNNTIINMTAAIIMIDDSDFNNITNNTIINSTFFALALGANENTNVIAYNNITGTSYIGLFLISPTSAFEASNFNLIENNTFSNSGFLDMLLVPAGPTGIEEDTCNNQINNNTGSGGNPILFLNANNNSTSISGSYSELIICGASNVTLNNIVINSPDGINNNGILAYLIQNSSINNVNSNGNAIALHIFGSKNVNVSNINSTNDNYAIRASDNEKVKFNNITIKNRTDLSGPLAPLLPSIWGSNALMILDTFTQSEQPINKTNNTGILFNNVYIANSTPILISAVTNITNISMNVLFDNPYANLTNYSNVTIRIDNINNSNNTTINWASKPANLTINSTDIPSFYDKFIEINATPGLTINELTFYWTLGEEQNLTNISLIQLWKYNGTDWVNTTHTINTTSRKITLSNFNPGSIYGLFYFSGFSPPPPPPPPPPSITP
ncbi:MAG: NosD domain-containing protein, partial [Candidatus Anstonellales archaeon]